MRQRMEPYLVVCCLLLAGCGDDGGGTDPADTGPSTQEPDARALAIDATIEAYPVEVDGNGPTREDVEIDEVVPVVGREDLFFVRHRYYWHQGCAYLIRVADGRGEYCDEINPMQYMSVAEVRTRIVPALDGPIVEAWTTTGRGNGYFELYRIGHDRLKLLLHTRGTDWHGDGEIYENGLLLPVYQDVNSDGRVDVVLSGRIVSDDGRGPSRPCTKTLIQQTDGSFKEETALRVGFD